MARPRNYDEDAVLSAAMHAFRRHGYGPLSIKQLEDSTGLKAGSIYNSFGDKAGLFEAALAHYNDKVVQGRIDTHLQSGKGVPGLQALFLSLLKEPDGGRHGCLLTNTAIEFGGAVRDEAPGRAHLQAGLERLRKAFARVLSEARAAGDLPPGIDIPTTALQLLTLYQGILVLVRSASVDDRSLRRLIGAEFRPLQGIHTQKNMP